MKRKVGLLLSLLLLVSCDNHKPTRLIILLVGDQMRPDHLSRFESLYTGGFKCFNSDENERKFKNVFPILSFL